MSMGTAEHFESTKSGYWKITFVEKVDSETDTRVCMQNGRTKFVFGFTKVERKIL